MDLVIHDAAFKRITIPEVQQRVNLTLLVGIFGFISSLLLLPFLFSHSLFGGEKHNGIPWRWAILAFGWVALAQWFVFLILKGSWG